MGQQRKTPPGCNRRGAKKRFTQVQFNECPEELQETCAFSDAFNRIRLAYAALDLCQNPDREFDLKRMDLLKAQRAWKRYTLAGFPSYGGAAS